MEGSDAKASAGLPGLDGSNASPYREGKPLAVAIAPDHRRRNAIALVLSSMVVGVVLWVSGGLLLEALSSKPHSSTPAHAAGSIRPGILHGADRDVALPMRTVAVLHVWSQGCQDCMPAFDAMQRLEAEGGLGLDVPVYNVAYGEADPAWAAAHGVRDNLVYDVGGALVVRPLGISSFTTLVVDASGAVLLRERPDRPGYRARVRAAVNAARVPPRWVDDKLLDTESVSRVVAAHRSGIRQACWERYDAADAATVTVDATIEHGVVLSASSSGSEETLRVCVESQVKTWSFPVAETATTVHIPFRFEKQR